ncbi:PR domain zinc finger protein 8 [Merluccius polli]|uniref:PR domain zinc finger protein 8 n=1 Tax=Merluccius polli TaxID=89951 RepID=A0AA47M8M0_MERPO|nr:PR domain zinc finger protein 8 [Merluccius polli]
MMDHAAFASRSFWANDNKFLPDVRHAADVHTSVVVTRLIPRGASFGPCLLHGSSYDAIAFIALKSCDRITKSYVFRIDPEVMLVLSWLRLVQAARSREEQNAEAYLKAGQLHVRATRDVGPEEELLVWYDQELSHLLGLTETAIKERHEELKCAKCNQVFKHEYPYLAHCRFLCAQLKGDAWSHDTCGQKDANKLMEIKRQRRVTDFHNIARDLEHKKPSTDEDAETSPNKRKCEESVYPKGRKSVLLETTNIANDHNITPSTRDYEQPSLDSPSLTLKLRADKLKAPHIDGRFTHDRDHTPEMDGGSGGGGGLGAAPLRSAFSALSPSGHGEQKSAFCKPSKRTYNEATLHPSIMAQAASSSSRLDGLSGAFTPVTVTGYTTTTPSLMAPSRSLVTGELPTHVAINNAFHYHGPEHWSRNMTSQLRTTSSLAVLPPTFTSFAVSVQNWCAKCNLSFRMTSDLVFHMRSHHKKEFAAESQVRRRREEKLTCPICHERQQLRMERFSPLFLAKVLLMVPMSNTHSWLALRMVDTAIGAGLHRHVGVDFEHWAPGLILVEDSQGAHLLGDTAGLWDPRDDPHRPHYALDGGVVGGPRHLRGKEVQTCYIR